LLPRLGLKCAVCLTRILGVLKKSYVTLENVRHVLANSGDRMLDAMSLMINEVHAQLNAFDLPKDSEKLMIELVEDVVEYLVKVYMQGMNVSRPIKETVEQLSQLLDDVRSVGDDPLEP